MTIEVNTKGLSMYNTITDRENFFWRGEDIDSYIIHFYGISYTETPFLLYIDYDPTSISNYLGLFITIPIFIILCILLIVCFYRCSKKIALSVSRERQLRLGIEPVNANRIVINIASVDTTQINELLKTSNNAKLAEMIKNELRPIKYKESSNEFKDSCSICLEEFIPKSSDITVLHCKHIFHHMCIKDWLNKNLLHPKCPNCNYNIIDKEFAKTDDKPISNNYQNINNYSGVTNNRSVVNSDITNRSNDAI